MSSQRRQTESNRSGNSTVLNETGAHQNVARKQRFKELLERGTTISNRTETENILETFKHISELVSNSNSISDSGHADAENMEVSIEVLMDVQVIKMGHDIVAEAIQKAGNNKFSDVEFSASLMNFVCTPGGGENWNKLDSLASSLMRPTKFTRSLYGSFEHEAEITAKIAKERQKRNKTNESEKIQPEKIDRSKQTEVSTQNVNLVMKQIEQVYRARGKQPIPYFELICDPSDFMNTVANAFQVSFLVRDRSIELNLNENNLPMVTPVSRSKQNSDSSHNVQACASLNVQLWKNIIEKYAIKKCLLKSDLNNVPSTSNG